MRWIVSGQAVMGQAASTSQMGRFETEVLAKEANVAALADLSGRSIDVVHARRPTNVMVLGMHSSVSPRRIMRPTSQVVAAQVFFCALPPRVKLPPMILSAISRAASVSRVSRSRRTAAAAVLRDSALPAKTVPRGRDRP
jgi:hypothetical protein